MVRIRKKIPWGKLAWLIPLWLLVLAAGFQAFIFWGLWVNGGIVELHESLYLIRWIEFIVAIIIFGAGIAYFFRAVWRALKEEWR
jgi:hypothetical protein